MNILIPYDGSDSSKLAIQDLANAGLPKRGVTARVLSVGEFVFPIVSAMTGRDPQIPLVNYSFEKVQELSDYAMESADSVAYEAQQRVIQLFPDWTVERWTRLNSPASTILEVAKVWDADLIVMGSHGRSLIPRLFLGSVSLRVSSEAACSVRIVKRPSRPAAPTLVLAFDDSAGSRAALREVMHREWPRATAIHVATVADVTLLASLNYMEFASDELVPSRKGEETKIEHLVHSIECELQKKFLTVTSSLVIDAPVTGILNEAKAVNADTIFLGSHGHSKVHRMLLGSVAHGVCARAEMNVEIVRARS